MKKDFSLFFLTAAMGGMAFAMTTPQVTNVRMEQDESHRVTISYSIDAPAIVTLSIETNTLANGAGEWIDIGAANLGSLSGDVQAIMKTAGEKTIIWKPTMSWPGQVIPDNRVRAVITAYSLDAPPDYLVVNLAKPSEKAFFATAEAIPDGIGASRYKTDYLVLRKIPAANVAWRMGSPVTEACRDKWNEIPHRVTLSKDFYLGVYEVTQAQFRRVMGSNPSYYADAPDADVRPVESATPNVFAGADGSDMTSPSFVPPVTSFTGKLRSLAVDGIAYTLPTEAQFEFACRAGAGGGLYTGKESTEKNLSAIAWHAGNWAQDPVSVANGNCNQTHAVGLLQPNAFGLYDMIGNVSEWMMDGPAQATAAEAVDPCDGAIAAGTRIMRGGSYIDSVPAEGQMDVANSLRCGSRRSAKWWGTTTTDPAFTEAEYASHGFRVAFPADFR